MRSLKRPQTMATRMPAPSTVPVNELAALKLVDMVSASSGRLARSSGVWSIGRRTRSVDGGQSSRPSSRWPMRSRLVRRYSMFSGLGADCSGTRSVISRPKPSMPPYLAGLLVM